MSEKPILFNTAMVQAILAGDKTCTRRVIKNKYSNAEIEWFENKYGRRLVYMQNDSPADIIHEDGSRSCHLKACEEIKAPYKVGDILYVRETFANIWTPNGDEGFVYKADGEPPKFPYWGNAKQCKDKVWIPSIHMPKEAARIWLKVTDVRAERIHDITDEECYKEGIGDTDFYNQAEHTQIAGIGLNDSLERAAFALLWNSTLKRSDFDLSWNKNPWVWVIEFEKVNNYGQAGK